LSTCDPRGIYGKNNNVLKNLKKKKTIVVLSKKKVRNLFTKHFGKIFIVSSKKGQRFIFETDAGTFL